MAETELAALLAAGGPRSLVVATALRALDPSRVEAPLRAAMAGASPAAGIHCRAWLMEHGFDVDPSPHDPGAVAEAMAWTLVAVARAEGPEGAAEAIGALGPVAEQVEVVEMIGRTGTPFAEDALRAVADGPVAREVGKVARRALHRLRTSGSPPTAP